MRKRVLIFPIIWVVSLGLGLYGIVTAVRSWNEREDDRCRAAIQTILDEADWIEVSGKFPGQQVTDRWKKLLGGCQ